MSGSTWVNFIQNLCCHRDGARKRSYIAVARAELLPQRNSLTYERFRLTSTLLVTLIPFILWSNFLHLLIIKDIFDVEAWQL